MRLLTYSVNTGKLSFNIEDYGHIKEFMDLVKADKGSPGDYRGDKKLKSTKEFGLIWWCNDPRSPGIRLGLTGDALIQDAKNNFNVDDKWTPSNEFYAAESAFVKYNSSIVKDTYKESIASFKSLGKYITVLRTRVDNLLENIGKLSAEDLALLTTAVKELTTISTELPAKIKALKQVEKLLDEEEQIEKQLGMGGRVIPDSADPKTALS